jgi:CubicO group peptidase (beta-lactamase class C family)
VYLGRALEHKFKKSLVELSDSLLFKPLGMKDTRYWDKSIDMLRYAHWHDSNGKEYETSYQTGISAADLLLTTIEDYCKFMIYVVNGAGLSTNLYNDMISPQVYIKEHYARGLGWEVIRDLPNGEYALEHGGSDNGVKTIAILLPKSKRGIVVLTNGDNGMFVYHNVIKESLDIGQNILDYMNGSNTHKIVTLSGEILARYVGTYLDSYGRNLIIIKEDSALKISGNGVPTLKLYPETENKFFPKDFDVQFEFVKDDSLIITANGKIDCTAKKIK